MLLTIVPMHLTQATLQTHLMQTILQTTQMQRTLQTVPKTGVTADSPTSHPIVAAALKYQEKAVINPQITALTLLITLLTAVR